MSTRTRTGRSRAPFSANYQVDPSAPKNLAVVSVLLVTLTVGLTLIIRGLI